MFFNCKKLNHYHNLSMFFLELWLIWEKNVSDISLVIADYLKMLYIYELIEYLENNLSHALQNFKNNHFICVMFSVKPLSSQQNCE